MPTQAFSSTALPATAPVTRVDIRFNGSISFDRFMQLICDEWKMPCRLVKLNIVYSGCICLGDGQLDLLGTAEEQRVFYKRLLQQNLIDPELG